MDNIYVKVFFFLVMIILIFSIICRIWQSLKETHDFKKQIKYSFKNKKYAHIIDLLICNSNLKFIKILKNLYNINDIITIVINTYDRPLLTKIKFGQMCELFELKYTYNKIHVDDRCISILDKMDIYKLNIKDLLLMYILYALNNLKKNGKKVFEIKQYIFSNFKNDTYSIYGNVMNELFELLSVNHNNQLIEELRNIYDVLLCIPDMIQKKSNIIKQNGIIEQWINGHHVIYYDDVHKYYVDNKEVPSVSTIIKHQSAIYKYDDYDKVNSQVLFNAAEKGSRMHKIIQDYEEKNIYEYYSSELKNYIQVMKEEEMCCLENEILVLYCSKNGEPLFCGRVDMLVLQNNKFGVLDLKRTSKIYYEKFTLQLNLYRKAFMQSYGKSIDFLYCLRLRNDKKDLIYIDIDEDFVNKHILEFYNYKIEL